MANGIRIGSIVLVFVRRTLEQDFTFFDLGDHPLTTEGEVLEAFARDGAVKRRRRHSLPGS